MIYFRARSNTRQIISPEHFWCWAVGEESCLNESNTETNSNCTVIEIMKLFSARFTEFLQRIF